MATRIIRDTKIIWASDLMTYLALKNQGYTTLWSGEGKICLEAPAIPPNETNKP